MGLNADWMQRDLNVLWHPCTQMKTTNACR